MWLDETGATGWNQLWSEWRILGGSPAWWSFVQVDIGKKEPETLEEIDPHWRAKQWLQVAIQDITDEEVPWHELLTLLTSGAEDTARSLAKCLGTAWQWNVKVQGEGKSHLPPPSSILVSLLWMRRWWGCGRATLVHGLLPHTAAGGRGSPWKKMGVEEGSPRDQSLSAGACFLAQD